MVLLNEKGLFHQGSPKDFYKTYKDYIVLSFIQ